MSFTHSLSTNNYGPAKFIVSSSAANGTHTTITAAMAAASSGDTIFIRTGSYSESLTLKPGVALTSFEGDGIISNVIITGTLTMTGAGNSTITGVRLASSGSNALVVSGANSCSVNLQNVIIQCNTSAAISFTNSNASSGILIYNSEGDIQTSSTPFFSMSSPGTLLFDNCRFTNSILSTTASTISAGNFQSFASEIFFPITSSSTASLNIQGDIIDTSAINTTALTIGGSGTNQIFRETLSSGTASALSVSSSVQTSLLTVNSSNTNAITGGGTVSFGTIDFTGSSSTINTSTQTPLTTEIGTLILKTPLALANGGTNATSMATNTGIVKYDGTRLITSSTALIDSSNRMTNSSQPSFLAYLSASTAANVTGDGTVYQLICDTVTTNVGSSYNNSTGAFTAPVTGNYLFNFTVQFFNLSAGHTNNQVRIITTGGTFLGSFFGFTAAGLSGTYGTSMSVICPMTAGDTATFDALAATSTKTVGFDGGASPIVTFVSGMLIS